jgi:opacity protein-like surface antigen
MTVKALTHGFTSALRRPAVLLLTLSLLTSLTTALRAQTICYPPHEGLPNSFLPPTPDGYVEPELGLATNDVETGWNRATRITYIGDGTQPLMVFQALKHNSRNFIYLSFDVRVDESFDNEDMIVLVFRPAFSPAAHSDQERRIDIFPVTGGANGGVGAGTASDPEVGPYRIRQNYPPRNVEYKKWCVPGDTDPICTGLSNAWGSIPSSSLANIDIKVRSWDLGATNKNWSVEVKLPTQAGTGTDQGGAEWINLTNNFGFYFDVIRVCDNITCSNTPGGGSGTPTATRYAAQYTWPRADYTSMDMMNQPPSRLIRNPPSGGTVNVGAFEIPPSWLGEAIMGPSTNCRGVRFYNNDPAQSIGIRTGAFPTALSNVINGALNATNVFAARVVNDGTATANDVKARFRIANWGIIGGPGTWENIPPKPPSSSNTNPTTGVAVPVGTTPPTEITMSWQIDAGDRSRFISQGGTLDPHQCIWVMLDSGQNVEFADSSIRRNMDFVGVSTYEEDAEISGKGYPAPPSGSNQDFLLRVYKIPIVSLRKGVGRRRATIPVGQIPSNITDLEKAIYARQAASNELITTWLWGMNGYRNTGATLTIGRETFKVYEPVGAFAHAAEHRGEVKEFNYTVTGPGLQPLAGDGYRLAVPDGGAVRIHVKLEAVEAGPTGGGGAGNFSVGLRGGVAIPHGNFGNLFDPGVAFTADLEYHATNTFSLFGLFGYRRFNGGFAPINDVNLFQFSAGTKAYLAPGSVRPFVNAGAGAFKFDPGNTKFGVHAGGGLQFVLTPKFSLEGEYNYHTVFTPGTNVKFSTAQGGVRFRF